MGFAQNICGQTSVLIPGVLNAGDIEKIDECKQAAALAKEF